MTITPTNVTIANPLIGATFNTTHMLPAMVPGFNNQYVTFVAAPTSAAVLVGGSVIAVTPNMAFPALSGMASFQTNIMFSTPLAIYDFQTYNVALSTENIVNMASGQPCFT